MDSRTQYSRPRPDYFEAKVKAKARAFRGQGQDQATSRPRSRPRTNVIDFEAKTKAILYVDRLRSFHSCALSGQVYNATINSVL